jgi:hypothetical protein
MGFQGPTGAEGVSGPVDWCTLKADGLQALKALIADRLQVFGVLKTVGLQSSARAEDETGIRH